MSSPFTPATIPSGGASPLTTKGDLYTYTNADARLGVGSDGTVLVANSGESTGLKWTAGSAVSAMTLLSTTTLGADGTFDIQNISQAYNDLALIVIARGTDAGAFDSLRMRVNNVATATYGSQYDGGNSATPAAAVLSAATSAWVVPFVPSAASTAGLFVHAQVLIPGYASTTWIKTWTARGYLVLTNTDTGMIDMFSGACTFATTAISRVQIFGGTTANLLAGSTVRVYGIL